MLLHVCTALRCLCCLALALVSIQLGLISQQDVAHAFTNPLLAHTQVPAWRAFFSGVGDLQLWVPVLKEKVRQCGVVEESCPCPHRFSQPNMLNVATHTMSLFVNQ